MMRWWMIANLAMVVAIEAREHHTLHDPVDAFGVTLLASVAAIPVAAWVAVMEVE